MKIFGKKGEKSCVFAEMGEKAALRAVAQILFGRNGRNLTSETDEAGFGRTLTKASAGSAWHRCG